MPTPTLTSIYRHHNMYTTTHHHIITIEQTTVCMCVSQTECALPRYTQLYHHPPHKQIFFSSLHMAVIDFVSLCLSWNEMKKMSAECVCVILNYITGIYSPLYTNILYLFFISYMRALSSIRVVFFSLYLVAKRQNTLFLAKIFAA